MSLFITEIPFHVKRRTSDAMDFGGSTGPLMGEDIGGTGEILELMHKCPSVAYIGGIFEGKRRRKNLNNAENKY